MSFKISSAPCCWGVEDYKNPDNPSWEKVLDEASKAGYKGIELGPYGYLPQDIEVLENALRSRNLSIVAGTIYDNLTCEDNFESVVKKTRITCELISKLSKSESVKGQRFQTPYLVVIDEVNSTRGPLSGHPDKAPRLSDKSWDVLVRNVKEIARISWEDYKVRAVIHPHAGGYIEYEDEIEKITKEIPKELAGLCLDTGHLYYDKMDPVKWLMKYSDRLDYVHFKDIDKSVYDVAIANETDYFEACKKGVMCPIGQGIIDYEKINDTLNELGYKGWITIEQERDPKDSSGSLLDVKRSLDYLKGAGY